MVGGKRGVKWGIAAGVVCLALGAGIDAESFALALNPGATPAAVEYSARGVNLLRALLLLDGLAFLFAALPAVRSKLRSPLSQSIWAPREGSEKLDWFSRRYAQILPALLLIALAIRLIALNTDLWMDEVFTLVRTVRPPLGRLVSVFVDDNQHTLYSLLAKGSVALFGETPVALRLPAVLFGVASIWAAARLAALVFGRREALLAATLLTFSYHHVWFSQNARGYTILLFVATLSTELLLRGLRTGRWREWLPYAGLITFGAMAHLSAVFLAVAQAIVVAALLLRKGRPAGEWAKPAAAYVMAAWLTLHCYALMLPQMAEFFAQPGAGSAPGAHWTRPLWMVREALGGFGLTSGLGLAALAIAVPAAGFALLWIARRDGLFLALTLGPAILSGGVLYALGRSLWPRSFVHLTGLATVAIAAAALAGGDRLAQMFPRAPSAARFAPACLLCVCAMATLPAVFRYPKQDYTHARDFVRENLGPEDTVATLHMAGRVYSLYYAPEWRETNTTEELETIKRAGARSWVIYTLPSYLDRVRPDLRDILNKEYELVRIFPGTLRDGDLFVMRSRPNE